MPAAKGKPNGKAQLIRDLKNGDFAPLYIIYGEESYLKEYYPKLLSERYKLSAEDLELPAYELLEQIGRNRGCLLKGNKVDLSKTSKILLSEFRQGKIGRITLERFN